MSRLLLLSLLLSGCASPSLHPGIESFGTRAAYSTGHFIVQVAKPIAVIKLPWITAGTFAGPYEFHLGEIDMKPVEAAIAPSTTPVK
jgi:hypothetical protein